MKPNRKSKDTVFRFIFGNEQRKNYTLRLYNALNGTSYTDAKQIKLITLEDVIYITFKNDIGFLLKDELNLYEQQSSWNPNMPARLLRYYVKELTLWEDNKRINLFSSALQLLPVPKMAVFYNGRENQPAVSILKLSDSFGGKQGSIEVTVPVYNIGTNSELTQNCRPLYEYCWFIRQLEGADQNTLLEKIINAADNMPEDFEIRKLLQREKRKVTDMMYSEYMEEYFKQTLLNDGKREGIQTERLNSVRNAFDLLKSAGLTSEQAKKQLLLKYSEKEISEALSSRKTDSD